MYDMGCFPAARELVRGAECVVVVGGGGREAGMGIVGAGRGVDGVKFGTGVGGTATGGGLGVGAGCTPPFFFFFLLFFFPDSFSTPP